MYHQGETTFESTPNKEGGVQSAGSNSSTSGGSRVSAKNATRAVSGRKFPFGMTRSIEPLAFG